MSSDARENIVKSIRYAMRQYVPMGPKTEQATKEWDAHLQRVQARKDAMEVLGLTERDLDLLSDMKDGW